MNDSLIQILNIIFTSYIIISLIFSSYLSYYLNKILKNPPSEKEIEELGIDNFVLDRFVEIYSNMEIYKKLVIILLFGFSWPCIFFTVKFD
jgi:hypothetical protein